jgi:hypothetical protein
MASRVFRVLLISAHIPFAFGFLHVSKEFRAEICREFRGL